ncbi:MAG: hypothetical protein ABWY25_12280 [Paenisporosarcina sp.]
MATVTGYTAEFMDTINNNTVIDARLEGNNLILVTRGGAEINVGSVRGPKGDTGATGPLSQADADTRYVNITGDVLTGLLQVDRGSGASAEGLKLIHSTSPYLSFYSGTTRNGYVQGRSDFFIIAADGDKPMGFYTNGVEQMRLRSGTIPEILTINGNPDALIYMRGSSPSGTIYNYFGKHGIWGFRATAQAGDILLQSATGRTVVQAAFNVEIYPDDTLAASFIPGGYILFSKTEVDDSIPGFSWHNPWRSLRLTTNVAGPHNLYMNRVSSANAVGQEYQRFDANQVKVGSISRTSTGVAYNVTSDYRVKDVKGPVQNALEKIVLLNPVRAVYKNDLTQSEVDTFVAHEVANVVPQAVFGEKDAVATVGNSEISGVPVGQPILQQLDTSQLIPLLVASVKELSAKVDALQARVDNPGA